jgi:hypothetical protein
MASSYKGLYVQRLSSGGIYSVQVVDSGGNAFPLEPAEYVSRGIQPPIDSLPDLEQYQNLKQP